MRLRTQGVDARSVLSTLRPHIVGLESRRRDKLLEQLRLWEIDRTSGMVNAPARNDPSGAPLAPPTSDRPSTSPADERPAGASRPAPPEPAAPHPPAAAPTPSTAPPADDASFECPHCGRRTRSDDIFCGGCGQLVTMERSMFDTRHFVDNNDGLHSDEHFDADSILVFMVKGTQETFKVRPQDQAHEVVVGRGAGAVMRPDIDLGPHQAALLGVSRLHLSITYHEKRHTLSVADLGSSNGTFINGLRLHPDEVRIIRHGDELRLGKLVLMVYFYRAQPSE